MFFSQLVLFCVLLVGAVFGPNVVSTDSSHHVMGGTMVNIDFAPYQVSMQVVGKGHLCGGSIISAKWILTAAHCTRGLRPSHVYVRVGSTWHYAGGWMIPVERIIPHQSYASGHDYDFALLKLKNMIVMGKYTRAIALPAQNEGVWDGTYGLVSGWGTTERGHSSSTLLAAYIPTYNQDSCKYVYARYVSITPRMICAGYVPTGGRGSCYGDSGGPLVANEKLIGVVSGGIGCSRTGFPSIFGRVAAVRNWIRSSTGGAV